MALVDHLKAVPEEDVVAAAFDWAIVHGMAMVAPGPSVDHVPFTLLPTPFPRDQHAKAIAVQRGLNRLLHALRLDVGFIKDELGRAADADPFTGRLLQMVVDIEAAGGVRQPLALALHRTDYMLHDEGAGKLAIRQVEVNTISAAFAGLGVEPRRMHRFVLERYVPDGASYSARLPPNGARAGVAAAFAVAVEAYRAHGGGAAAVMVMVVQPGETNAFDQRMLEFELWESHGVSTRRYTLAELNAHAEYSAADGTMTVHGDEVALVYYRAGYRPDDYPTETEWAARAAVERSKAIKCPSLLDHLTGAKKMQQVLAAPGMLERLPAAGVTPADVAAVRSTFAGLYQLDNNPEGDAAAAAAVAAPSKYVLKPQREGGGNNLYEADMQAALGAMSAADRAGYILMERLYPPAYPNLILRGSAVTAGDVVSELGVYGYCLSDTASGAVCAEGVAGHLLRSKLADVLDGGVAAGRAVLDSPLLS